ncbi:MAG: DUF1998 domain-containing protein [Candidatus Cloacimonetes bacterium]|jgi:hypothetical protein|nr:DUF1998 domain-containing protein [Candidatus Cloacimonadota bacterium]MDD2230391.1 DUF1998 domain-containing protein [Candidatus Cloacimonadota bacterium]
MNRYYELSCHGVISSYGGIGSLIETPEGSLQIQPLEKWPYFIHEVDGKDRETVNSISVQDHRLISRLKATFPNLTYLLKVPSNSTTHSGHKVASDTSLISAEFFPQWMFCPVCKRFMKYSDWQHRYKMTNLKGRFNLYCPDCQMASGAKKAKYILLEQVRFIQVSEAGQIGDFPWEDWFNDKDLGAEKCEKHEFMYRSSANRDNLGSIWISCKRCKLSVNLSGIFNPASDKESMQTVLKSSNSVYFPEILRSLMIPVSKRSSEDDPGSEMNYRCDEFEYMISKAKNDDFADEDPIYLKSMPPITNTISLISIRTLSMATVLCSYSRINPISSGTIFETGKSRHVTNAGEKTRYLPSVELAGEGFLMVFDDLAIRKWYLTAQQHESFRQRFSNHSEALKNFNPFGNDNITGYALYKYILLHTISHLLIKQLEFVCGYPASSLSERIYCSSGFHAGIMIYTVAGSEGSYGGIVTITERGDLRQLLAEAFDKARFCTNDPVCNSNNSVCFSCSLLPETSCESFNLLLDRALVINDDYGFIKALSR